MGSRRPSREVRRPICFVCSSARSIRRPRAASFTFNGQWTGNAFADFLLGYPSAAQVGIGRADEDGRTTWFHVYGQDDWRVRPNLTINAGLRYEINSQMTDIDNRLSAIDLSVPGGRFVIASDDQGQISPAAQPLLSQIPISYVTLEPGGLDAGSAAAQLSASRAPAWHGVDAGAGCTDRRDCGRRASF